MDPIVIILSAFILLLIVAIVVIAVIMIKQKKQFEKEQDTLQSTLQTKQTELGTLQEKQAELEKKIDFFMKQNQAIGIFYKTTDPEMKKMLGNLQAILLLVQKNRLCPLLRAGSTREIQDMIAISQTSLDKQCADIKNNPSVAIDQPVNEITRMVMMDTPATEQEKFKKELREMITTYSGLMCTGDKFDIEKSNKFVKNLLDTICYQE